jgi:hypothetical protein
MSARDRSGEAAFIVVLLFLVLLFSLIRSWLEQHGATK